MTNLAPILLFVYNRPKHTARLVESLKKNRLAEQSTLIIYADGAKMAKDRHAVNEVHEYIQGISGFAQVQIIIRDKNLGLAANIIEGVTTQINIHNKVIVLEDDLVLSPYFLQFMNDALDTYQEEYRVGHVQACDFTQDASLPETFLVKWTGSWGWATWKRAWDYFNPDGKHLLQELHKQRLAHIFDFNGAYPFTRMLKEQTQGKNNSWAIRWNASLFLANMLSLNVGRTLVSNEGFDGSGTHCGSDNLYSRTVWMQPIEVNKISPVEENLQARKAIEAFYRRTHSLQAKIIRRLKRILGR